MHNQSSGFKIYCLMIFSFLITSFVPSYANLDIKWTYYDINDKRLSVDATPEEINEQAAWRENDALDTQYALTIEHDFSGTWGVGYLENIGNPKPDVGKHWIDKNADVICTVDGIVQDVYNVNSRYIAIGYIAEGAPNHITNTDKANALIFNGENSFLKTPSINISKPISMSFEFWAKRDRIGAKEVIIKHNNLEIGFDQNDQAYFHTPVGNLKTTAKTYIGWYFWRFVYERYEETYHGIKGLGYNLYIYRDGIKLNNSDTKPNCSDDEVPYIVKEAVTKCYSIDKGKILGVDDDDGNSYWAACQKEWESVSIYGDRANIEGSQHPIQICADYQVNYIWQHYLKLEVVELCDQCYGRGSLVTGIDNCRNIWWGKGTYTVTDIKDNEPHTKTNSFSIDDMTFTEYVDKEMTKTEYRCDSKPEYQQDYSFTFGANDQGNQDFFKGKLKDIVVKVNQGIIGKWHLNDGGESLSAKDDSLYGRHANLHNFDPQNCWYSNQNVPKKYSFGSIETFQIVPQFKMNKPTKIIYDWSHQYAVTINTIPDGFDDLVSIRTIADESQSGYTRAGKYWYNQNSRMVIQAKDSDCSKLSGYRDNTIDPNTTIIADEKVVESLEGPQNISWIYSSYVFEETVTLGGPVMLSSIPPDIRNKLVLDTKPEYISEHILENDMLYWNDREKKVYPLRGSDFFDLKYQLNDATCIGQSVTVRITTQWPQTPHIVHIADTPPVLLDPSMEDEIAFMSLKHVENDAQVSQNRFTATQPGRSVLHFKRNDIKETQPTEISLSFDGKGYAETDPIIFPENFTIAFYAKRHTQNDVTIAIGHGDPVSAKGLSIGFDHNDHFIFDIVGDSMATSQVYTDTNWHHWACVYETIIESQTDSFTCALNDGSCRWEHDNCYTIGASGDYVSDGDNFKWDPNALITRKCANSVSYNRKIYRDGELIASRYSGDLHSSDNALKFNGSNEYAEIQYNENLNPEIFTISLWAKVNGGQEEYRSAITSRNGNSQSGYMVYASPGNDWHFTVGGGSWQTIVGESVNLNEWTHLAMTYDGTYLKSYVNGIYQGAIPISYIPNSSHPTRIGAGATEGSPQFYWNGEIDEVAIYNIALTHEAINETMNQYLRGDETGLLAYYRFNQSSGTILKDITNNGNNGTLINMDDSNWVASNLIPIPSTPYIGKGKLRIGANTAAGGGKFQGELDDIRIWGIAKTQEEIAESFNRRLTGNEDDLMAYFRMDRIGSSYLRDSRIHPERPIIAVLNNMDPSNAWVVKTNKEYTLHPEQIIDLGYSCVRVVQTKLESENKKNSYSIVGHEINGGGFHDNRVYHNGYVFYDKVPYNASIYNRETLQGPIYPVNIIHPDKDGHHNILVIWYKVQDGVSWPYQPVEYIPQWPVNSDRIVISSRFGSEGKNANGADQTYADIDNNQQNYFDPKRYEDIQIYNQPNPELAGYNPNEEHAIVTRSYRNVSMSPQPFAAYALRNDLNRMNGQNPIHAEIIHEHNALSFDGIDDYVDLGSVYFKPTDALSLELWLFCDWASSNGVVIGNTEASGYAITFENNKLRLYICTETGYQILDDDPSQLTAGWHHIAATFDGQYIKFYIDGEEKNSKELNGKHSIKYLETTKTLIGAESNSIGDPTPGWFFNGTMCQLRIWDIARTKVQIKENMHRSLYPKNENSLLACYTFNQTTETTLIDSSSYNRHGILKNMDPLTDWVSADVMIERMNFPDAIPGSSINYTSEPFVLVQLYDKAEKKHIMIPYYVVKEDPSCNYSFHYYMTAGDPVVPPFPLNEVIGATPPAEIFGFNKSITQNCYWKDHKGQAWAISGSGDPVTIKSVTLLNSDTQETRYSVLLETMGILNNDELYSVKVTDNRGIIGHAKFRVGVTDKNKDNSAIYIDGNAITNNRDSFTVHLRPKNDHLKLTNFKLFQHDEDIQLSSHYWYPLRPTFWLGDNAPGDGTGNVGQSIAWLPDKNIIEADGFPNNMVGKFRAIEVTYNVVWPDNVPVLKAGESLTFPGGEYRTDHSDYPGLPGVLAWATGQVVYDALNPTMSDNYLNSNYLVRMVPALLEREVLLPIDQFPDDLKPASGRVDVLMNRWYFKELHAGLKSRIYYDPSTQTLGIRGFINDKTLGDDTLTAAPPSIYVLQPNILTDRERDTIKNIQGADITFNTAVDNLYRLSRDPNDLNSKLVGVLNDQSYYDYGVGLKLYTETVQPMLDKYPKKKEYINDMFNAWLGADIVNNDNRVIPQISFGPGLAVVPNGGLLDPDHPIFSHFTEGYITLAENNHPDMGALPVSLHVIKVVKEKYRGSIKTVYSDNVFDEKITLRHSADFGANPDELIFEWRYRQEDGNDHGTPDIDEGWTTFSDADKPGGYASGQGMSEISLAGAGAALLVDNLFYVRYRHVNSPDIQSSWSNWAGAANSYPPDNYQAQLTEGWVKRVLNSVNPFEARVKNFYNSDNPATYVSMIRQAGPRYEGPVAFNPQKDVIENVGLIELYQTVLKRTKDLSINLDQPVCNSGVTSAILLAASRISGFYSLLGNEAYNDALDPTIGFGTDSVEYGSLAPTIFTFMNQLPDLIDEEYALLCGRGEYADRDEYSARPVYNRLLWNFTKGSGEVAYALSYNIRDITNDGIIDEADARALYPQGHGDAWGHYLTAIKCYYDLLGHPHFNWESRSEKFSVEGVVIDVDYLDERKFAEAAASKAKVGNEIVNITYRKKFVDDPDGQWQGYQDTNKERSWGVSGWSERTFSGAFFDWVAANAILPAQDTTNKGIKKVDRSTVPEIQEIAGQARNIQVQFDSVNNGLNPLGLSSDTVSFDINPYRLNPERYNTATHFEQGYERAIEALENARAMFDYANTIKDQIRKVAISEKEFSRQVIVQDRAYRNQLIEIFGTPYKGTIGSGKVYPQGYKGPDYYYYNYIDVNEVSDETIPPPNNEVKAFFEPNDIDYSVQTGDGVVTDLTEMFKEFYDTDLEGSQFVSADFSDVIEISFPLSAGKYSFHAPESWGMRQSPGEIQLALIELIKAEADLQLALYNYFDVVDSIGDTLSLIQARSDLLISELEITNDFYNFTESLNAAIIAMQTTADTSDILAEHCEKVGEAAAEALPKVTGMSSDVTSSARGLLKTTGYIGSKALKVFAMLNRFGVAVAEANKELAQISMEIDLNKASYRYDIQQYLLEINNFFEKEAPTRMEIFKRREHMRQVSEKYRSILAKGLRLLEERKVYNARVAQKTQGNRYMDMAFRANLNQSLSKYRNSFDLAARYVYLAAKAYDFETNFSEMDPLSAQPFLTKIVRQRHLGQYQNGQYLIGQGGLGEILSALKINFEGIIGRMGFNTPQIETGRFSLRSELFRLNQNEEDASRWNKVLKDHSVANLWSVPEFRNYCRPFTIESNNEPQPGIIIDFGTNILFGKNFFGWPLFGGDHAYDPTNYSTKIRSVGVWFDGYDNTQMAETPRVYLVPAGMDVMLVPNSSYLDTREWSIVDQQLPLPLPMQGTDFSNPDWIPSLDSLDGSMIKIRRFSSFLAFNDSGYFDESQVTYETRLVGRSVWNTRWMLIIPGGTFHHDPVMGINAFIENVSDIKLFFQTYAFSGN